MKIFTCRVKHGMQYGWGLRVGSSPCPTLSLCTTEGNVAALGAYLHPKHEIVLFSTHKDATVYDSAVPYYSNWPEVLGPGTPSKTSTAEWEAKAPEIIDGRTVFKPGSGTMMAPGATWKQGKEKCVQLPEQIDPAITFPALKIETLTVTHSSVAGELPVSVKIEARPLTLAERARLRKEGALP